MLNLSYIIATRNRLPFLKITLGKLLEEILPDEEIVVVDGNSTDGTKEYLHELYSKGKIHQFISEPDKNQAHAWNKAMLLAKGTLIKKIIDDDVFCYSAIRECKNYMLQNSKIDVCISNDLGCHIDSYKNIQNFSRYSEFSKWKEGIVKSFTFGDVHLLARKKSLAYIGLYNTAFVMMDWEYSLRISYLKANIAYYSGYNALSVVHAETVSSTKNVELIKKQGNMGEAMYEYEGDGADISLWSKIKIFIGKLIYKDKATLKTETLTAIDIAETYNYLYDYIEHLYHSEKGVFS